jgi:hypothetical protein
MDAGKDLELAITVLRGLIEEQFRIAERLDQKSRQAFTLAAAFFAVVQAVTFGAFAQSDVSSTERLLLLGSALVAGCALAATAHRLANAEEPREEENIHPERIAEWWEQADDEQHVARHLFVELVRVAKARAQNNLAREQLRARTATVARWAMLLTSLELLLALSARV